MTTLVQTETPLRAAPAGPYHPPVRFTDLVLAELRKLVDTRAGFWLHTSIVALIAVGMVVSFANPYGRSGINFITMGSTIASLVLPLSGILSLTSEWAQGSMASTFALVPRRSRIVSAKFTALLISTSVMIVYIVAASYLATLASRVIFDEATPWNVPADHLATMALAVILSMLLGAAFGALFMTPAVAIVTYLVLPLSWSGVGQTMPALAEAATWLDTSSTYSLLLQGTVRPQDWIKVAVSTLAWVAVPLTAGLVFLSRREIK